MTLAREMPMAQIAKLFDIPDTRLWRIIHHYVNNELKKQNFSKVKRIGLDETASKRGHNYISLFFDLDDSKLLFATPGKGKDAVRKCADALASKEGDPQQIQEICCDMSPAFIAGVQENFEKAEITFDRFHIMKIVNEAVDQVRREEANDQPLLRKTRYLWLKNIGNLTDRQQDKIKSLTNLKLKTTRAYQIKSTFQEFFNIPDWLEARLFLKRWYFWVTHSRLPPIIAAAKTIKRHWDGVLNWANTRLSNGLLEGFNSLLQAAKARARGYRSDKNFIAMAYLIGGRLDFALPT